MTCLYLIKGYENSKLDKLRDRVVQVLKHSTEGDLD